MVLGFIDRDRCSHFVAAGDEGRKLDLEVELLAETSYTLSLHSDLTLWPVDRRTRDNYSGRAAMISDRGVPKAGDQLFNRTSGSKKLGRLVLVSIYEGLQSFPTPQMTHRFCVRQSEKVIREVTNDHR